jgi:GNAT superfamily N-acetyltransferase
MTPTPFMLVTARTARMDDLSDLTHLYSGLAAEQRAIRAIWPYADGLPEPVEGSLSEMLKRPDAVVIVGDIDGVPLGFLVGVEQALLYPMGDRRIGIVHLVFTDPGARGVGVGAAMLRFGLDAFRERGIDLFDARVSPGHRLAKNFFESNGFKARSITMHRGEAGFEPAPTGPLA